MNVLVVPCGTEIGLEIQRALTGVKNINLFGLNSIKDYSSIVYENFYSDAPYLDDPQFLPFLADFIKEHGITHVFPAHDAAALLLSANRSSLNQVKVITSSHETNMICRSKKLTYQTLKESVSVPKSFTSKKEINDNDFPIFMKPDVGQGSKGIKKINAMSELSDVDFSSNVVTEFLPGPEYTVDCFTDVNGNLLYVGPRQRNRIQNGIAVGTETITHNKHIFETFAEKINSNISFKGAWFFQVKEKRDGEITLMEAAPRIAGSMSTNRVKGVNFAELSLYTHNDISVSVLPNTYNVQQERALSNKYILDIDYQHVYVDFDDCLIFGEKVNHQLISFLYKAINNGCKLYLVTRHEHNIQESLEKFRLSCLFDEVYHITDHSPKSAVIAHNDAIFIDDSYRERVDVMKLGVPSFSVDCIEALL
tara:strand:+ start:656 stop:1921 length:1266 start_codon:yes stop_codon:yes gene_type:complete